MGTGFFLFFFLFQPFQVSLGDSWTGHNFLSRSLIYAVLVFISFWAWEGTRLKLYYKRCLQFSYSTLFLFFGLNYFWGGDDWTWSVFLEITWQGSALNLLLLFFWTLFFNSRSANAPKLEQFVEIHSDNGKEILSLKFKDLLFLKSESNYIEVHYLNTKGALERKVMRKSLKAAEEELKEFPSVIRVQKQYLVNLKSVLKVERGPKKWDLEFTHDLRVPIGKSYQESFQATWQSFAPK